MTVYVDPLNNWGWKPDGVHEIKSCHLFTDSSDLAKLHELAHKIGMKREWFQNKPEHPHYDLTAFRRAQAVKAGAIEVDWRMAITIIRARRFTVGIGA